VPFPVAQTPARFRSTSKKSYSGKILIARKAPPRPILLGRLSHNGREKWVAAQQKWGTRHRTNFGRIDSHLTLAALTKVTLRIKSVRNWCITSDVESIRCAPQNIVPEIVFIHTTLQNLHFGREEIS